MSDYFESEEIVKSYDRRIARRLLSCLKPYRLLTIAALAALAVSTAGELLIPILQQRVIDNAILARFITLKADGNEKSLSPEAAHTLDRLKKSKNALAIDAYTFVLRNQDTKIPEKIEKELRSAGFFDETSWYAFRFSPSLAANAVIAGHSSLFVIEDFKAAIREIDLAGLTLQEKIALRAGDISFIVKTVLITLAVLLLVFVFTFLQTWSATLIGQRVMKDIRLALFEKTASQSTAFLSRHPVGRIVTRLTGDVETINQFFTDVLSAFLKDFSVMIGVFITLFLLSAKLALTALVIMPPALAVTAWARIKARDAFRRQRVASSQVNAYLSERLSGAQAVQIFCAEKKSAGEFNARNNEYLSANLGEMYVYATFRPIVEWLSVLTTAAIIVAGAYFILNLSLSLGVLIAFINLVGMFYNPISDIAEKYTLLQSAMAGAERVFNLLDADERIPDQGTRRIQEIKGQIRFENVHFSYKEGEEILKGLTFTVNPGEMVAIVGYTGAGKTTITNLLTRLWDVDRGEIFLDGVPIKEIPLKELRSRILPVLQDVFLFSGAVADNIGLGLALTEEEIQRAASAVSAAAFIEKMPDGYNTELSEGAANISAGQRQLISFARVIAHNPAVVVLDEATSSIDTETERAIQNGAARLLAGRTSLVIAHRLSTIRHADRILALSNGRIAEEGVHAELIEKNGLYAQLYKLQFSSLD
jgi:ATP-binding cassette subfamily B protein